MALLFRCVRLNDRANSSIFTFIVTKSVTRDLHRDVTSKEFSCCYHRWAVTFSRTDKLLGVYLVWRNLSAGMKLVADFSFTLLNREHFSMNETFSAKQVKFSPDLPAQGNRKFITIADLCSRNFTDENGEFLLELAISNVRSVFHADLTIPPSFALSSPQGGGSPGNESSKAQIDSPFFSFGGLDWNIVICAQSQNICPSVRDQRPETPTRGSSHQHHQSQQVMSQQMAVRLNRLTGFDHQCRVKYAISLGEGERRVDSGMVDDVSDMEGRGMFTWCPRARVGDLAASTTGKSPVLRLNVEMILANPISETLVTPAPAPSSQALVPPVASPCYDRDMQAWYLEADVNNEDFLRLRLVYKDVRNVPRNHLRFVMWQAYVLRKNNRTGRTEPVRVLHGPFSRYFSQDESDEGLLMLTDVPVNEMKKSDSVYLDDKRQIRVQIEWLESMFLFQASYHKYDDVCRVHNYQMRREISALETENYDLERQLFSYQRSIAVVSSKGQASESEWISQDSTDGVGDGNVDGPAVGVGNTYQSAYQQQRSQQHSRDYRHQQQQQQQQQMNHHHHHDRRYDGMSSSSTSGGGGHPAAGSDYS